MLFNFKTLKKRHWVLGAVLLTVIALLILWGALLLGKGTFYKGVRVDGVDVSGLTKKQALLLLSDAMKKKYPADSLILKYQGMEWTLGLKNISFTFHLEEALEKAWMEGRSGNIVKRLLRIAELKTHGINIRVAASLDRTALKRLLQPIKREIDRKAENASIIFNNGEIDFADSKIGLNFDIDTNAYLIENELIKRNFSFVELEADSVRPRVSYEDIKDINDVIASFYTTFNPGDVNRTHNIKLACSRLNNMILMDGDIFSMDKTIGTRTVENGYKDAPVIFKNEFIQGPGGGVCQVTTTLYGAVLRTKLEVKERTNHSLPLGYVEPGQDATISEGYIDFKFKNVLGYPICLQARVNGNRLEIFILGRKKDKLNVKIKSQVVKEYLPEGEEIIFDESVPIGERITVREAKKGLKAVVYREIYTPQGELTVKEKVSEDVYKPVKAQVKMNPYTVNHAAEGL